MPKAVFGSKKLLEEIAKRYREERKNFSRSGSLDEVTNSIVWVRLTNVATLTLGLGEMKTASSLRLEIGRLETSKARVDTLRG